MTSEQLRKILSVRATSRFGERIGRLIAREGLLAETIDLGTDPDPRIAFRASYALEYAFAADPKRMEPHLSAFVDRYAEVSCHGAQRHFSKILALLLRQKSLRLDDRRLDRTIEVTFDRMIDRSVPVAVKVWAMEILARLADKRPWIGEQLGDTIRHLMDCGGSPGLCSRGRKICRRLSEAGGLRPDRPKRNMSVPDMKTCRPAPRSRAPENPDR